MWAAWPGPRGSSTSASAGYINARPLEELAGLLDGACIDLEAFDYKFYRELVDAELEPVLNTLKTPAAPQGARGNRRPGDPPVERSTG